MDFHFITIVDFGSQYTRLVAKQIRKFGVYSIITSFDKASRYLNDPNCKGLILSGGPKSVDDNIDLSHIIEKNIPILGICFGHQLLGKYFGGKVEKNPKGGEFGPSSLTVNTLEEHPFLHKFPANKVWMSHHDVVSVLPETFISIASTQITKHAIIQHKTKPIFGVQFHPEVDHTEHGDVLFKNFTDICKCERKWVPKNYIDVFVQDINAKIAKDENVILGLSGGVDSSVCAYLLRKAIGNRLKCVFINNGLLRKGDVDHTLKYFKDFDLTVVDASTEFLSLLNGVSDPEHKRKIIGNTFINIFERESKKLNGIKFLAQGTIYPDVIESAKNEHGNAHLIKSHHNVGGLPEKMNLQLIEPLRFLFKNEVREMGQVLGVPNGIIHRHPFPGPGLAIRITGAIDNEKIQIVREADHIFMQFLHEIGAYNKISQAYAGLLSSKSVGVVGDQRRYGYIVILRCVETNDFMTANAYDFGSLTLLSQVANKIVNQIEGISRVVYDITSKPPATIELE